MDTLLAKKAANNIRILAASMVEKAKSGHPGGAMGAADFIHTLYHDFMVYDPDNVNWAFRDRLFLDPGHMSPMLYAVLGLSGFFSMDELKSFRQWGSITSGHPELNVSKGIENTSGPLGQGHAMGVGAAIAAKMLESRYGEWLSHYIYAFISDGGIQEEISQGAGRVAGTLKLGNFIMFYDANEVQLSTKVKEVSNEDTAMKYRAWGWHVQIVDGNDFEAMAAALKNAQEVKDQPSIIIGNTIMGKGCIGPNGENMEGLTSTHGQPISKAGVDLEKTITAMGGDPQNPFCYFPEVAQAYAKSNDKKRAVVKERKTKERQWRSEHPEKALQLDAFLSGDSNKIDFLSIAHKPGIATRAASADVLALLAKELDSMIVASADLSNSDKTDGFLKNTTPFSAENGNGKFLNIGVSELTMASLMNGIVLHSGFTAACGTFFVFSDYIKPALRMSALQELPVKFIWTHDSFRVGEDGPTHQPIEQLAQLQLMEMVRNLKGDRSVLVLRPADGVETSMAWKMALENTTTPTALVLTRQNVTDLPAFNGITRKEAVLQAKKGAYIANADQGECDITLIGSGSDVGTLYEAAQLLRKEKGLKIAIVSIISNGLFMDQEAAYRSQIIPKNRPVFGLVAGLETSLSAFVGERGYVHGIDHFGHSAPANVLDEKFGFTSTAVAQKIEAYFDAF